MSKARAEEALQKSEDYKKYMAALASEQQSDLQPPDGYVNPMARMGVVPSGSYSEYNMV